MRPDKDAVNPRRDAYRDTWGRGRGSYLSMLYEHLVLVHDLLADDGSDFLHLGADISHYGKILSTRSSATIISQRNGLEAADGAQ